MSDLSENSTEELLKQLLATVSTLQNDVNELKEGTRAYAFVMVMAMAVLKLPVTMVTMWKAIAIAISRKTHLRMA